MESKTISVLFIIMAIYYIIAVASEVIVDDFVRPRTMFLYLLAGCLVSSSAAMILSVN